MPAWGCKQDPFGSADEEAEILVLDLLVAFIFVGLCGRFR